jgi:competence protein ComFB
VHVTNLLEKAVPEAVEKLVAEYAHISACEDCKSDVLALALSNLHPEYASTEMGRILKRIDVDKARIHTEITVAVLTAIDKVNRNPHHTE